MTLFLGKYSSLQRRHRRNRARFYDVMASPRKKKDNVYAYGRLAISAADQLRTRGALRALATVCAW